MEKRKREKVSPSVANKLGNNNNIPQDIITEEIFTRLPVKTLARFSCVCKLWFNLISNPNFIKTHLSKSRLSITNHRLLLGYCVDISPLINYYFNTYPLDFYNENNGVSIDIPTREPIRHISILGSCNGLVCIANTNTCNRETLLWNPVTRKSKILPVDRNVSISIQWRGYGFGYDQSNDDYKVVMMFSNNLVKIYSLKTGSWKKINDCPHGIYYGLGECVNGVMYWNVRSRRSSTVILSLNLGNETYGKIAQPPYGDGFSAKLSLGVLDGSLSIFCYFDDESCIKARVDIWVMKGSGAGDTWIKLYTIPFTAGLIGGYYPLCILISGEILWRRSLNCLEFYSLIDGKFRNAEIAELPRNVWSVIACTYVESLVSPNIDDEVVIQQL